MILLKSRPISQPAAITRGPPHLIAAWCGNTGFTPKGAIRRSADLSSAATIYGRSNYYTGAGNGSVYFSEVRAPNARGFTIVAIAQPEIFSDEVTVAALSSASSSNEWVRIQMRDNGGPVWNMQSGAPVSANMFGSPLIAGQAYVLVAVWRPGTQEKSLWVDGVKVSSSTTNWGSPTPNQFDVGILQRNANPVHQFQGAIPFAAAFSVPFSDSQCIAASINPYRLLEGHTRFVPVPFSGPSLPTLSTATYVPGSLTSSGFRPRVTLTY